MDIENLIEQLNRYFEGETLPRGTALDAATALSTLQAENEKLRAELEYEKEHANAYYEECGQWEAENEKLRNEVERQRRNADDRKHLYENAERAYMKVLAELERVTAERDAAIDCCSGYCATCLFVKDCAKHDMNDAAPTRWYYGDCEDWEWRGWKED